MTNCTFLASALSAVAVLGAAAGAQVPPFQPVTGFRLLASFEVQDGVAEIVDATSDGKTLVYTDSAAGSIGFVDISDPAHPQLLIGFAVNGEPTSVSVSGSVAVATVWIDRPEAGMPPPAFDPGALVVMDVRDSRDPQVLGTVDIGWHPDSVKLVRGRGGELVAVIAVENEPVVVEDGVVTGDDRPGSPNDVSPAGYVQVVTLDLDDPAASQVVDLHFPPSAMRAAGLDYPADPQPEFVAVHGTTAAVSLQENDGVAMIDISDALAPRLDRLFSLGVVTDRRADLTVDGDIRFDEVYPADVEGVRHPVLIDGSGNPIRAGARDPDAIAFHPDGTTLYTADEGEMNQTGGRGASAWSPHGRLVWDSGPELEGIAAAFGYYPEARSASKGIEVEGVATATFGDQVLAFFLSERGSFCAVYDVTLAAFPRLLQVLPTGVGPEGVVAIPARGLLVTSDEASGTLTIFAAAPAS